VNLLHCQKSEDKQEPGLKTRYLTVGFQLRGPPSGKPAANAEAEFYWRPHHFKQFPVFVPKTGKAGFSVAPAIKRQGRCDP